MRPAPAAPDPAVSRPDGEPCGLSPIESYLGALHARLAPDASGAVATYIPQLSLADPMAFGVCIATVEGHVYAVGDADAPFTIQSMSKPFTYGAALDRLGRETMLRHVGVEPTGDAFNSIVLDDRHNRPFNPMVNAGAIAVAELTPGDTPAAREAAMTELFSRLAGRPLTLDTAVYRSESATGHRNRAIAYMMLNSGMIRSDPEAVLDLYFRQCSILVTATDMALMAATLANRGVQPRTGEPVFSPDTVGDVLTLMSTCGMYNYAGQWAYEVGFPAKSGVSGGVIAVIPGQAGIAVWSPPLDAHGNSVRGIAVCKELSRAFGLHAFGERTADRAVIRRERRASEAGSKRLRTAAQRARLAAEGGRIAVIELQGALYFGSTEVAIRRLAELAAETTTVIVDFRRVGSADRAAIALLAQAARDFASGRRRLVVTGLAPGGRLEPLRAALAAEPGAAFADDVDTAVEAAENALLGAGDALDPHKFALSRIDLFKGLGPEELRLLEAALSPFHFDAGQPILREGDAANAVFVIVRGSASVYLRTAEGKRRRISAVGPGFSIGEMALIDGGRRMADVIADEPVICYAFAIERLRRIADTHPNVLITILTNLVAALAQRLRLAGEEIRSLE